MDYSAEQTIEATRCFIYGGTHGTKGRGGDRQYMVSTRQKGQVRKTVLEKLKKSADLVHPLINEIYNTS